ncbi:hypothetical protein U0070_027442, partial [Myodes glareolus]
MQRKQVPVSLSMAFQKGSRPATFRESSHIQRIWLDRVLVQSQSNWPCAARLHAQQALAIGRSQDHHLHPHWAPGWLPPHPGRAGLPRAGLCTWAWWSPRRNTSPASQTPHSTREILDMTNTF